jgi:hypothetical protein
MHQRPQHRRSSGIDDSADREGCPASDFGVLVRDESGEDGVIEAPVILEHEERGDGADLALSQRPPAPALGGRLHWCHERSKQQRPGQNSSVHHVLVRRS